MVWQPVAAHDGRGLDGAEDRVQRHLLSSMRRKALLELLILVERADRHGILPRRVRTAWCAAC